MKKINPKKQVIPTFCGVYVFLDKKSNFLYIGKAKNIQKRIKNHFTKNNLFIHQTEKIGIIETKSEFLALILESELIKKHQPKFNVLWKDDKNYFYLNITQEKYPRIIINHEKKGLGPFVKGKELKRALEALRYIFPYYSSVHKKQKCTFCYLGLCPGPNISVEDYKKNIKSILAILSGKKKTIINSFKKEMKKAAQEKEYEKAAIIRDKIKSLEKVILEAQIIKENSYRDYFKKYFNKKGQRLEAYDISNIQGKQATGSMVVFLNGKPAKNLYRKFKISTEKPNDIAMIKEVLIRRLNHQEWSLPDFILIDGGKAQLNVGLSVIKNKSIEVAALAKKNNELFLKNKKILLKDLPNDFSNLILRMRDEAHRFAISYHKQLRNKNIN